MATSDGSRGSFEIGRVISRAFDVVANNAVTFLTLAVVMSLPTILFRYFTAFQSARLGAGVFALAGPGGYGSALGMILLGALIYYLFASLLQASLTHGTIVALNGRKASVGDCLATGLKHVLPLAVISFLATLGLMVGLILLVVPFFILLTMWAVLTPVRVAEQTSIGETFSRSADLTSGFRWSIFGLFIIYGVAVWLLGLVVGLVAGVSMMAGNAMGQVSIVYVVVSGISTIITSLFGAALIASAYYELRTAKEGIGPEQLAAVFE